MYETLDYEGEENHQHKSQWNPKAKSQRPGMTPKNNTSWMNIETPTPKPPKPPKQPKTPKPKKTPKATLKVKTPRVNKSKLSTDSGTDSDEDEDEVYTTPVTGGVIRKSGRTPKPKKMDGTIFFFFSFADVIKL